MFWLLKKKKTKKTKCPNAEDALAKNIRVESEDVEKKKPFAYI